MNADTRVPPPATPYTNLERDDLPRYPALHCREHMIDMRLSTDGWRCPAGGYACWLKQERIIP